MLTGIARFGLGVIGPVGHVDALHPAALARVVLQAVRCEPERPEPVFHRVAGGFLGQGKRQDAARFDVAVGAGVNDDRRCAKRAFGGVAGVLDFHLCSAVGAFGDTGFFHICGSQIG